MQWLSAGKCLFGLTLIYLTIEIARQGRCVENQPAVTTRLLLATLAAALMSRMILNGRIFQYGFYQAAVAGALIPAVIVGELPVWLGGQRRIRAVVAACGALLLLPGIVFLSIDSHRILAAKVLPVGEGLDRFYSFGPGVDRTGALVEVARERLADSAAASLLVLPEGVSINYLTRTPGPVPQNAFYSAATAGGREREIVERLRERPPERIVLIRRPLFEYGIRRYGEGTGSGKQIMDWVNANYLPELEVGADPLDPKKGGVWILKPATPAHSGN